MDAAERNLDTARRAFVRLAAALQALDDLITANDASHHPNLPFLPITTRNAMGRARECLAAARADWISVRPDVAV